jgi:AcrR family transcriptional regulator
MDYIDRIAEEAELLFSKYGIRAVTMDTIAHELGISKRTIYENFSDKDALLTHVIRSKASKQREIFFQIMEGSDNVIDVIFNIIETAYDMMRNSNPTYMMDLKKYHHKVYEAVCNRGDIRNSEMSLAILKRGVEESVFRNDINIEIVNEGIQGFIDSSHASEIFQDNKYSRLDILDNILISYLRGIATATGAQLIESYREKLGINKNEK